MNVNFGLFPEFVTPSHDAQGKIPQLPKFVDEFGIQGALIAAVDLVRGLGTLVGWKIIDVPGATVTSIPSMVSLGILQLLRR